MRNINQVRGVIERKKIRNSQDQAKKNNIYACYLIGIVGGGWSPIESTRPLIGLLCQPRVIMMMENLVESLAWETEVLGENLPQYHFVHHKPHMLLGREPGPPRWEARD
jgi:hypothetical protein